MLVKTIPVQAKLLFLIICTITTLYCTKSFCQVGIGTNEPDSSAELDIYSTHRGLLMPRLTTTQIFYIENPSIGLMAFNLDSLDFWYFDGKRWNGIIDQADTLNPSAWVCGIDISFGGELYTTIRIGTQCWLEENLNIGTRIENNLEQTDNETIEKYCYYNNEDYCSIYGGLYQWNEMMQYSTTPGVKGICPTGWHLPTDAEWTTLTTHLGGESVAGGKMKETGYEHWAAPNTGATNSSGFTALPGGYRNYGAGGFLYLNSKNYYWTSSESSSDNSWLRFMSNDGMYVFRHGVYIKTHGFSVRCIKDE